MTDRVRAARLASIAIPRHRMPRACAAIIVLLSGLHAELVVAQTASGADIVVTAQRYGAADVPSETELEQDELAVYGADSVAELIDDIAPLVDPTGEKPVVLVNGEPVGDLAEIGVYPPEVLARIAILKREAAARYGYPADRRVVNLELKRSFARWQIDGDLILATAGGRDRERSSASRVAVSGATRWNARIQASRASALRRSDRRYTPAASRRLPDETLLPDARDLTFNAGATRRLGPFSTTLGITAHTDRKRGRLADVASARDGAGSLERLLRKNHQQARSLGLSMLAAGSLGDWRTTLVASYSRAWSQNSIEQHADGNGSERRGTSRSSSIDLQIKVARPLATLPAGEAIANLSLRSTRNRSQGSYTVSEEADQQTLLHRNQTIGQLSLSVPLATRQGWPGGIGELSADFAVTGRLASGMRWRRSIEAGANWSPARFVQLRGSIEREEIVPAFEQLGAPRSEEVKRVYDYRQQELVDPIWITGGNPALAQGERKRLSLRATLRPLADPAVSINLAYRRDETRDGSTSFPELTPAIEAAFSDRVVRDDTGRLVSVDARPINVARDTRAELTTGITVRLTPSSTRASHHAAASDPVRLTFTASHRWRLEDTLLVLRGMQSIDQLSQGGQPRHALDFDLVAGAHGWGVTLSGTWTGPGRVGTRAGASEHSTYRYRAATSIDLELFANPEDILPPGRTGSWTEDLKLSLAIHNLFDGYRRVTLADGQTAPGFGRYELDPLGRTITIGVRKAF